MLEDSIQGLHLGKAKDPAVKSGRILPDLPAHEIQTYKKLYYTAKIPPGIQRVHDQALPIYSKTCGIGGKLVFHNRSINTGESLR